MDEKAIQKVTAMERGELVIFKTPLQRETVYRRLRDIHDKIVVKEADKPGWLIVSREFWGHTRVKKRQPNKSGYDPSVNLKRNRKDES